MVSAEAISSKHNGGLTPPDVSVWDHQMFVSFDFAYRPLYDNIQ